MVTSITRIPTNASPKSPQSLASEILSRIQIEPKFPLFEPVTIPNIFEFSILIHLSILEITCLRTSNEITLETIPQKGQKIGNRLKRI